MKTAARSLDTSLCDLPGLDALCDEARLMLESRGEGAYCFATDLLLREFVNNGLLHGNRSAPGKSVTVSVRSSRAWIKIQVTDEGPGFDWRLRKKATPDDDATSGRGLAIGLQYADRVQYNFKGNRVTLWIRKAAQGAKHE